MWPDLEEFALQIESSVAGLEGLKGFPLYVGTGMGLGEDDHGFMGAEDAEKFLSQLALRRLWFAEILREMTPVMYRFERLLEQGKYGPGYELQSLKDFQAYLSSIVTSSQEPEDLSPKKSEGRDLAGLEDLIQSLPDDAILERFGLQRRLSSLKEER